MAELIALPGWCVGVQGITAKICRLVRSYLITPIYDCTELSSVDTLVHPTDSVAVRIAHPLGNLLGSYCGIHYYFSLIEVVPHESSFL